MPGRNRRRYGIRVVAALPLGAQMYDTFASASPELGTAVDAGGAITISGGKLSHTAINPALSSSRIYKDAAGNGFARTPGRAFIWDGFSAGAMSVGGWLTNPAAITDANLLYNLGTDSFGNIYARSAGSQVSPGKGASARTSGRRAIILLSTGALEIFEGRLIWFWRTGTTTPLYPILSAVVTSGTATWDSAMVVDLAQHDSAWGSDWGQATSSAATPTVGQVYTQARDAFIAWTMTAATGITQRMYIRWESDNDCFYIQWDEATDLCKLFEVTGGVTTERGSLAWTQNNGTTYTISVITNGRSIKVYNANSLALSYTSANHLSGTGVKLDRAGTNLVVWPLDIPLPVALGARRKIVAVIGDSKSNGQGDGGLGEFYGVLPRVIDLLGSSGYVGLSPLSAVNGRTTATWAANIDAECASFILHPDYVLVNTSVNDIAGGILPDETTYRNNLATVLDTVHSYLPDALIGVARVWLSSGTPPTLPDGYATTVDTYNAMIDAEIAERAWAVSGIDERLILRGHPERMADGAHPNATGYAVEAPAWITAFGL